ncbi:MAG: sulfurtransferase [Thermomicrobiales bacterium]
MAYGTLISVEELNEHLQDADWVVVDCKFNLADHEQGRKDYVQEHIPGAVYAHLDEDLSGPIVKGVTGRHPLPSVERAAEVFSRLGIADGVQVVAYDDRGGMSSGRLWWMLRWLGHKAVAVLDGGWQAWQAAGYATRSGEETRLAAEFVPQVREGFAVDAAEVGQLAGDPAYKVVDSRAADRYRGENETMDPVGGHIPGAYSGPFGENLGADGKFKSAEELRARFEALLGDAGGSGGVLLRVGGVGGAQYPGGGARGAGGCEALSGVVERVDRGPGAEGGDGAGRG